MATPAIPSTSLRPDRPKLGPPPGVFAAASAALFVAGLAASTVAAGGDVFPSPFAAPEDALFYFTDHRDAVRLGATLQFAAAIPGALFVAAITARLRTRGALALTGGALATGFLMLSAVVTWVLTVPEVIESPHQVRALHTLAFLAGGPANVVSTGLLIAGIGLPALHLRPWLARVGLVIAIAGLVTTATLMRTEAAVLLPLARFTGMAWLIAAGFLVSKSAAAETE
ncbi:hypothetical protein [Nocardia beijingensis]|uniref:DUF998 domain-containing protein n=1 Tax=Nocardia beijingensis TaxID=95162 RepID=A0ABW7WDR6_9NOCA